MTDDPFFDAAKAKIGIGHNAAKPLQDAVMEAIGWEETIQQLEEDLANANRELNKLRIERIPALFNQIMPGTTDLTVDGWKVDLFDDYVGGLTKDEAMRNKAFAWLEENDGGAIIKTKLEVALPKSELEKAKELAADLAKKGFEVSVGHSVHASTLKAWVKERVRSGQEVDFPSLGMIVRKTAKFKQVAKKK